MARKVLYAGLGMCQAFIALAALAQDNPEAAIQYRQKVMQGNVAHLIAIISIAKGDVGHTGHLVSHAESIAGNMAMLDDIFPEGTGPSSGVPTAALSAIWDDPGTFDQLIEDAQAEAAQLLEVAGAGDVDAVLQQVGSLGRNGCGACHLDFAGKVSYNLQTVPIN